MKQLTTYYDTLQVSRFANEAVIRAAYRTLAQKYHPDKNPNNIESANRNTKRLNEAYDVLSDPIRRIAYNEAVTLREDEIKRHQTASTQREESANNGGRGTSDGYASKTSTPHPANSQRERAQGASRFDNSVGASYRSSYTPSRKNGNIFTAFFVGFMEGPTVKDKPVSSTQTNAKKGESVGLTFWNVIVACLFGGWILALGISKRVDSGHDQLGFFSLLFNPGFLGMTIAPTAMLVICTFIGWSIGWMMPATRRHASWAGLMLAVGGFLTLASGGRIQQPYPVPAEIVAEKKSTSPPASVDNDQNAQQLYDAALKEIEARYPVLNPDKPEYRPDLIAQVIKQMGGHINQGIAKHNALRLAIVEMERPTSQAHSSFTSTRATLVAAPIYSPPAYVTAPPTTREFTIDEKVTISIACNDYQIKGDINGFQSCMSTQSARALTGNRIPSMAHLTIDEKVTISIACNDFQINGDINGFQSCMSTQIAKTVH